MKTQKNNQETDIQSSAVTTGQKKYLRHQKLQKLYIFWSRILIFIAFLMLWQISADFGWIDSFYFSSPTAISQLFWHDIADRSLLIHIGITLLESGISFVLIIGGSDREPWLARNGPPHDHPVRDIGRDLWMYPQSVSVL